jgi:hypothetical protein
VTLYFAPPTMPYSSFYIAYSRKPDSWEYGTEFSQGYSGGVIKYTINALQPNTTYYFKVRAGNGCATGNWGNTMTANTLFSQTQNKTYYKNVFTAIIQQTKQIINNFNPSKKVTVGNNGTAKQQLVSPLPSLQQKPVNTVPPKTNITTPKSESKTLQATPVKNKFCILFWCF